MVTIDIVIKTGWKLNDDEIKVNNIIRSIGENGGHCPTPVKERYGHDQCPCCDYLEHDICYCGLYVKEKKDDKENI